MYPDREEKGRRRAVWYENGQRRQCEAGTEQKLTAERRVYPEALGGLFR